MFTIITLASSKGGVGKSTLTCALAGAWAKSGHAVHVVDLDNNRTASRWFKDAAARPANITVSSPEPAVLTEHLAQLAATIAPDVVLIDIAGTYERALTVAVARAHLTLIPASPSEADIFEAKRVVDHISAVFGAFGRTPLYRVVLNRVQSLSSSSQLYTIMEIVRLRLARIRTRIMQRAAYEEIGLSGLPPHFADAKRPTVAKAVEELDQLRADIEQLLAGQASDDSESTTHTLEGAA